MAKKQPEAKLELEPESEPRSTDAQVLVASEDLGGHKVPNHLSGPFSVIDKVYIPGLKQRKSSRCGFQKASSLPTKATKIPAQTAKKSAPKKPAAKKPAVVKKPAKPTATAAAAAAAAAEPGDKRTRAPIVKSKAEEKVTKKVCTTLSSFQDESTPSTSGTSNESSNTRRLQEFLESFKQCLKVVMHTRLRLNMSSQFLRNNK